MPELNFTIPGKPISKARPRFFRRGNFVGTYNAQETEEGRFMLELKCQMKDVAMIPAGMPIQVNIGFFMPIPKSLSKKKKALLDKHTAKPDLDNLIKFVKDCATGVVWHDDSQVWKVTASKRYSECPSTYLLIEW